MKISQAGLDAIKRHEGLRLHAYLDSANVPTIGYGHTAGVQMGQHISEATAEQFLRQDLEWAEATCNNAIRVPVSQAQYDAMVSLCFNIGAHAFKNSTLVEKLNAGDTAGAANEFLRWDKATVNGAKQVIPGLSSRRAAERQLFLAGASAAPPAPPAQATVQAPAPAPAPPPQPADIYGQEHSSMPIPAIVGALLPAALKMIPKLAQYFPGGRVSERNVALATEVLAVATKATSAPNAQAAVEAMTADPAARQAVQQAIDADWAKLHKLAEDSTAAARQFAVSYASNQNVRTVVGSLTFLELLSLVLVVASLSGGLAAVLWGGIDAQLKGAVVTLMLIGGFTTVTGFWFGSSLGSKKKDDELTKDRAP